MLDEYVMRFIVPKNAKITRIFVNGEETKIDPPIEIMKGDLISFPCEEAFTIRHEHVFILDEDSPTYESCECGEIRVRWYKMS